MEYLKRTPLEREQLLASLAAMRTYLREVFASLTADEARRPGPQGAFSPVEQVWHLADLEREGFGARIQRLRAEVEPHLPDFDGAAMARERDYGSRSLAEGLEAFETARAANLAALAELAPHEWSRAGTQEGVGRISLCDLPSFLEQHDRAHREEIEAWRAG